MRTADELLKSSGYEAATDGRKLLDRTTTLRKPPVELQAVRQRAQEAGVPLDRYPVERTLLIHAGLTLLNGVEVMPLYDSVRHLICKEIAFIAAPFDEGLPQFAMGGNPFYTMCNIVLGKRFPAGQHHWEITGFPRSWLIKAPLSGLPKLLRFLLTQARGFNPYFETHLTSTIHRTTTLVEGEFYKSFYRMARSLEAQEHIRGIMACSWLHSPATLRVSPHLAFMNRPYQEAGGVVVEVGISAPHEGFLAGSPERTELYRSGAYKPTRAVAVCSRKQALAWTNAHPEIGKLAAVVR